MEERSQYNSAGYTTFKMKLKRLIGIDLNSYKEQIHRRTHELMNRWGCKTYDDSCINHPVVACKITAS